MKNLFKNMWDDNKLFLKAIFISSFIIRLLAYILIGEIENPQMYEHGEIARNLYYGYGFTMHWPYVPNDEARKKLFEEPPKFGGAYIPPLNPIIIYLCFLIFGISYKANILMTLINITFSVIGIYYVFKISKLLFNENIAKISAIIASIYLPNIFGITTYSGAAIYQTIALAFIYYLYQAFIIKSKMNFFIAGIILALFIMIRSEILLFGLLIVFIIFIKEYLKFHDVNLYKNLLALLIPVILIVSPWIIRNTIMFGKFTTIVSHPWHEFWRGNNELSSGGAYNIYKEKMLISYKRYPEMVNKLDKLEYNQNLELAIDSVLKEEALSYWQKKPNEALSKLAKRALIIWTFDPYTPRAMNPIYLFFISYSIIFSIYGLYIFIKKFKNPNNIIILNIIISFLALYYILFIVFNFETRYQIYLYNLLLPFSGAIFYKINNLK